MLNFSDSGWTDLTTIMSVSLKTAAGPGVSKKVKVERPRPLKIGGGTQPELGVEDLVVVADNVSRSLAVMGQHQQATPAQTNFHLKSQLEEAMGRCRYERRNHLSRRWMRRSRAQGRVACVCTLKLRVRKCAGTNT